MNKNLQQETDKSNMVKDPDNWTTGDEAMTGAQKSYLSTLCQEAGEQFDETLSKAEASKRIDELQQKTGRGAETVDASGQGNSENQNHRVDDGKASDVEDTSIENNDSQLNDSERFGERSEIPFSKAEEVDETASKREPDDGKIAAG